MRSSMSTDDQLLSSEPLLHSCDDDEKISLNESINIAQSGKTKHDCRKFHIRWIFVHITLILLYSTLYITATLRFQADGKDNEQVQLPLPARDVLRPQVKHFPTDLENNPFAGAPRPELDEAWHNLLQNDNIQLPQSNLEALNLHSVNLRDQSAGIASLSVYHSLHCVKLVRKMMYKDHYHVNKTSYAMRREMKHADHCIEYLRETLMCKPDISLVTFRWINSTSQHPDDPSGFYPTNFDSGPHECVNWSLLDSWAAERSFDLYNLDLLDRPLPSTAAMVPTAA